jgi:hypothetical protein
MKINPAWLLLAYAMALSPVQARADDAQSQTPYIDTVRKRLQEEGKLNDQTGGSNTPYIDSLKAKMAKPPENDSKTGDQDYIDAVRKANPDARPEGGGAESYLDQQKQSLPAKQTDGAIAAVQAGKSDLQMKRDTNIHNAAGFRIDAPFSSNFTATGTAATSQSYNDIYGSGTLPSFTGFYELQPFHSESIAQFGLIALFGLEYASGYGKFGVSGVPGISVPASSLTKFHFFEMPVGVGLDLRLNFAKYIKPNFTLAPMTVGFLESRSDGNQGAYGYSVELYGSAGVWFLLDWIGRGNTWDMYRDGVKHYYLTAELTRLNHIHGDVSFDDTALTIGFAFEF